MRDGGEEWVRRWGAGDVSVSCLHPLRNGVGWRRAGSILYRGSSWDCSDSFRSQAESHVCEGSNDSLGVVRPVANWTLHTSL